MAAAPRTDIAPTVMSAILVALAASATMAQPVQGTLEGTYWRATELAGKATPSQRSTREPHLEFKEGRVSGSDGCNRVMGSYELKGDAIAFGQVAGTQMACGHTIELERAFRDILVRATRVAITAEALSLFDSSGTRIGLFTADHPPGSPSPPAPPSRSTNLAGTSWQLVKFQGGDDTTLTPDDGSKYTIEFGANGRMNVRIDCNRGAANWTAKEPLLELGPLALTRMQCPPGSLHDHIVKQWPYMRSYVIRDGHLFLSLIADGGIYEFEPLKR
jgi:heat shock protein HslJ